MRKIRESFDCDLNIYLECDKTTLQKRYRPPFAIVCPFYIQIKGTFFPNKTWDDFVVPILTDWLKQMTSLEVTGKKVIELNFMEGSYFIRVIPQGNGEVKVLLVSVKRSVEKVVQEILVKLTYLRDMIYQAAKKLADGVSLAGIQGEDYNHLKNAVVRYNQKS